jgi:hypothetical protein
MIRSPCSPDEKMAWKEQAFSSDETAHLSSTTSSRPNDAIATTPQKTKAATTTSTNPFLWHHASSLNHPLFPPASSNNKSPSPQVIKPTRTRPKKRAPLAELLQSPPSKKEYLWKDGSLDCPVDLISPTEMPPSPATTHRPTPTRVVREANKSVFPSLSLSLVASAATNSRHIQYSNDDNAGKDGNENHHSLSQPSPQPRTQSKASPLEALTEVIAAILAADNAPTSIPPLSLDTSCSTVASTPSVTPPSNNNNCHVNSVAVATAAAASKTNVTPTILQLGNTSLSCWCCDASNKLYLMYPHPHLGEGTGAGDPAATAQQQQQQHVVCSGCHDWFRTLEEDQDAKESSRVKADDDNDYDWCRACAKPVSSTSEEDEHAIWIRSCQQCAKGTKFCLGCISRMEDESILGQQQDGGDDDDESEWTCRDCRFLQVQVEPTASSSITSTAMPITATTSQPSTTQVLQQLHAIEDELEACHLALEDSYMERLRAEIEVELVSEGQGNGCNGSSAASIFNPKSHKKKRKWDNVQDLQMATGEELQLVRDQWENHYDLLDETRQVLHGIMEQTNPAYLQMYYHWRWNHPHHRPSPSKGNTKNETSTPTTTGRGLTTSPTTAFETVEPKWKQEADAALNKRDALLGVGPGHFRGAQGT